MRSAPSRNGSSELPTRDEPQNMSSIVHYGCTNFLCRSRHFLQRCGKQKHRLTKQRNGGLRFSNGLASCINIGFMRSSSQGYVVRLRSAINSAHSGVEISTSSAVETAVMSSPGLANAFNAPMFETVPEMDCMFANGIKHFFCQRYAQGFNRVKIITPLVVTLSSAILLRNVRASHCQRCLGPWVKRCFQKRSSRVLLGTNARLIGRRSIQCCHEQD